MSQLADLEHVVRAHTETDEQAGALFLDIIQTLNWDIDGVVDTESAAEYLNRDR